MNSRFEIQRIALFIVTMTLASACKQVSDEGSALMNDAGKNEVDLNKSVENFNLAEWIVTKNIGGINLKNNVKGKEYIFFSSNEEEKVDKENQAEAAKSKNKSFLAKPEFELRLNATVTSSSTKAELKSLFWIDGSLNGSKVYAGGNAVEASMVGSAKSGFKVKGNLKAFGKDLINQEVTLVKPFKISKVVNLEAKQTVLGIPKLLGVEAGVSFVANATVEGETDYVDKEAVVLSFVPSVKATAGIQGTVKALMFASASAKGTVTIFDAKMPSSVSLGGRVGTSDDFLFGNIIFESTKFSALAGEIVIGASLSTKGAELPKGVEAALWTSARIAVTTIKQKLDAGWEWVYKVWDSPALVNVKFPTAYSSGFFKSSSPSAACAAPSLAKVVVAVQKENTKDAAAFKGVGKNVIASLKAIHLKAKTAKGTCSIAAKPPAKK